MVDKLQKVKELQELNILMEKYSAFKFDLSLHISICCYRIAEGFVELEQLTEGEIWATEACKLQKNFKYSHNLLGIIFKKQQRTEEALKAFKIAMDIDSSYLDPLINTIEILLDCISERVKQTGSVELEKMEKVKSLLESTRTVTKSSYDEELQKKLDAENAHIDAAELNKLLAGNNVFNLLHRCSNSDSEVKDCSYSNA